MTAEREIPEADPSQKAISSRYSHRILSEIDSQQSQISAQAVGQARRPAARSPNTAHKENQASAAATSASSKPDTIPQEADSREYIAKDFHRREQALRRKLELQKWYGKYSSMLIEASPEYRLGMLMKKVASDLKDNNPVLLLTQLDVLGVAEAAAIRGEIERILSEGEILEALLPLLDPVPNI